MAANSSTGGGGGFNPTEILRRMRSTASLSTLAAPAETSSPTGAGTGAFSRSESFANNGPLHVSDASLASQYPPISPRKSTAAANSSNRGVNSSSRFAVSPMMNTAVSLDSGAGLGSMRMPVQPPPRPLPRTSTQSQVLGMPSASGRAAGVQFSNPLPGTSTMAQGVGSAAGPTQFGGVNTELSPSSNTQSVNELRGVVVSLKRIIESKNMEIGNLSLRLEEVQRAREEQFRMCQEQDHRAQQLNRELQQVQGKCASLEQQLNESMSKQTFLQEQRDELLKSLNLEQQKGKEDKSDLEEHAEKLEEKVEELKRKNRELREDVESLQEQLEDERDEYEALLKQLESDLVESNFPEGGRRQRLRHRITGDNESLESLEEWLEDKSILSNAIVRSNEKTSRGHAITISRAANSDGGGTGKSKGSRLSMADRHGSTSMNGTSRSSASIRTSLASSAGKVRLSQKSSPRRRISSGSPGESKKPILRINLGKLNR